MAESDLAELTVCCTWALISWEEARALRDEVLPRAAKVYEALNEGYRRGKFSVLDLLEARRTLARARLHYVDALVRLNIADADLRRLTPDDTEDTIGAQP